MKYNKTVRLKNGKECVIRNATEKDGKAALDLFVLTHEQSDFLRSYPEENSMTVEDEIGYIVKKCDSENETELVAVVDGKTVGLAGIQCIGNSEKLKHRADFGISIDKDYWGLGIGKAMTEACIECAKTAGYTQLELEVVADNKAALSLYKSEGFVEFGRNPKGFRSRLSGWQELILMLLELN
ncbi:MAG: GNAT family N-acetyltransferase [Clostridia bacterium]|nr:GNAT family N-acetyltransferase [Clostridia bacterium]